MTITVDKWAKGRPGIYIGRAMPRQGLKGSPLGNPFKLDKNSNREEVLGQYAQLLGYILKRGEEGRNASGQAMIRELDRLTELARADDLVLLCWCKDSTKPATLSLACHGDVIKAIIEERLSSDD